MRNAILVLLVLGAAAGLWWASDREPNLSAGQAQLDAEREARQAEGVAPEKKDAEAAATATELASSLAESDPYETVDDPRYRAARAEREQRLEQIRDEAERRARDEGRPFLGGGGRGSSGDADAPAPVEPAPVEDDPVTNAQRFADLESQAAEWARQNELVPESVLDGLSPAEQQKLLAEHAAWEDAVRRKWGDDYPLARKNDSAPVLAAIQSMSDTEKARLYGSIDYGR